MKRRRQLTPEERELWDRVARTATRKEHRPAAPPDPAPAPPAPAPAVSAPSPAPAPRVGPFRVGSRAPNRPATHDIDPGPGERLRARAPAVDKRTLQHLSRGKRVPDARLDLHGMTLDVAHRALTGFLLRAQGEGLRLCLVITGKGRSEDADPLGRGPVGALRRQVPDWLDRPPLAGVVQQVLPAHRRHGGSGAYYVYLRRRR